MEVDKLRGMGGACFPTFRKWTTVRDVRADEKYALCNGDESEPGTFKDREFFRRTPHLVIEGIIMAGLVTGAEQGWIFIRHEYAEEIAAVRAEIARAAAVGSLRQRICSASNLSFPVDVFVSPGGYICGEETALMEAMEDRRAEPRNKPPLSVFEGFRGKPTVINNVETYSWVPVDSAPRRHLVSRSGDQRRGRHAVRLDQRRRGAAGRLRSAVRANRPRTGDRDLPAECPRRQKLKAVATSGPSGGFLPVRCHGERLAARNSSPV